MSSERHFLHDLIGPLSNARALIDILIEELNEKPQTDMQIQRLMPLLNAIEKATDLVAARRDFLVNNGDRHE
jgi:hypothetical protein